MAQPDTYNNENELIDWLKYDLEEQRKEIAKDRGISKDDVKDEELVLHIGDKNKDSDAIDLLNQQYTDYNIYFNFNRILEKIDNRKNTLRKDNKDYRVCKYRINARHCIFNSDFETYQVIFEKEINFFNSKLNKCNKNKVDNNFLYCKFKNSVTFDNCSFNTDLSFNECAFFYKITFCKSKLNGNIKFHGGGFYKAEYNKKSNNEINIYFNNSFIKEKLIMNGNIIENTININLNNISFENSKSLLSITNITNKIKSISFQNIVVGGIINIQNVKTEKVNFKGSIVTSGAVNPVEFKIDEFENRESALFLKNEAYARNNIIDALKYKDKEIEKHKEDLLENSKDYKDWGDIFSIYLSSLYSDNGLNWVKSFLCTILFSTFFFIASYINCNISIVMYALFIFYIINRLKLKDIAKYISNTILLYLFTFWLLPTLYLYLDIKFLKELFKFFVPTNFDYIENASFIYSNKISIMEATFICLSYFLGKIAFWYGSVQTVQAFRKFSKKE